MSDFSFSDDLELQKLNAQVLDDPEEFEHWEKLVRAAEGQEGGLHRNSSPGAIASTRDVYDKFLARFPLFFGFWKKYADLEFTIAGTEAAEMVYERGVASIGSSVDLWTNYCSFKIDTSHDADVIRELFERGADSVGLDFLAHPFWDKYLEFEERAESQDNIFTILGRIVHIPMHQYARYFERYRAMAANRPVTELVSEDLIAQFRQEIAREGGQKQKTDRDIQQEVRARVDNHLMESFQRTQNETTKRWTYESEIKRPYYHVTELDEPQLANWRKYLDFEEMEGDYTRTKFLYERCLVTAANYDEFWLRYARWMLAQEGKQEEVRNIYQRASCIYVPISGPTVRLFYARFEEAEGRPDVGVAIHEAILMNLPGHVETIISLANVHRRQYGLDSAIKVLKKYIDSPVTSPSNTGAFVSEWARMIWKIKGDADAAREIYQSNQHSYPDSRAFWVNWLGFEMQQPTSVNDEATCYKRVKLVYDSIRKNAKLAPALIQEMSGMYFTYLNERGGKDSMKELMALDSDINGPPSVALKEKFLEDGKGGVVENGHLNATANESAVQAGGNAYSKYYSQAGEQPVNGNQPAPIRHVA